MRMKTVSLLLMLAAMPSGLLAQTTPTPASPTAAPAAKPAPSRSNIIERPSLDPVTLAFAMSNLNQVNTWVTVSYDAQGKVTNAVLGPSSNNAFLDEAMLTWSRLVKFRPGSAGVKRIPFKLNNE